MFWLAEASFTAHSIPRIAVHEGGKSGATLAPDATFQIHRVEQPHWSTPSFITAALDASSTIVVAIGSCVAAVKEECS